MEKPEMSLIYIFSLPLLPTPPLIPCLFISCQLTNGAQMPAACSAGRADLLAFSLPFA